MTAVRPNAVQHILFVALTGALVVACGPRPATKTATPAVEAGVPDPTGACAAKASVEWEPAPGAKYTVTGAAAGPTCNSGNAVLTIRDAATGKIMLSSGDNDVAVMANTVFADATTPRTLETALVGWIDPGDDPMLATAGDLPEWKAGQDQPSDGEFPFYPEAGMTRAAYAALRARNQPLYCHVQGGESLACYALDRHAGTLTKVGLQTFPG